MDNLDNNIPTDTLTAEEMPPVPPQDDLANRYAQLQKKYENLQRQNLLERVSNETGCTDPEYLEFCAVRQQINIDDPETLRKFARELAAVSPGCFTARIIPGSSTGSRKVSPAASAGAEEFSGDRISRIALSIDSAPDAAGYR